MSTPDPTFLRWRLVAAVIVALVLAALVVLRYIDGGQMLQGLGIVWPR